MRRDYYAVLGVASTAGLREVRQAYRHLARQYSPDVNFWDAQARDLFDEIEEAYRVLSDPAARAMYDRFVPRTTSANASCTVACTSSPRRPAASASPSRSAWPNRSYIAQLAF